MDFRTATDQLFRCVSHADLAARLGCSIATIRQARLSPAAKGHRSPPPGWEEAVRALALEHSVRLAELAGAAPPE